MLVKVDGRPDLMKDTESGALISIDRKSDTEYRRQKNIINSNKKIQEQVDDIKHKLDELETVKNDVQEIKSLLKELVAK